MPKRVGGTRVGRAHENLGEARLRERHAKSFPTAQQTVGDGIRKKPLPEVPRKPVRRAAIDTTNVVNKLVNQLGDYRKKPSEEIPQSWDDNDPLYKGIDKYQKNHATQIEKYEKKFGAPRNKAEGHNPNYFREEFIKFMANIDANRPDLKYQGSKEARATNPGAATMKLKHFLGKKGMVLYQLAAAEEANSKQFMDAVFQSATKTYPGPKWIERLVLFVAGPSASGKSYAAEGAIAEATRFLKKDKTNSGVNKVVAIDGGVGRELLQMSTLVLDVAENMGIPGISDLQKKTTALKGVKKRVYNSTIKRSDYSMVIPETFSAFVNPFDKSRKMLKAALELPNSKTIFSRVDGKYPEIFQNVVAFMGMTRAWNTVFGEKRELNLNNKKSSESKKYGRKGFKWGKLGSELAEEWYLKHGNGLVMLITNDLLLKKQDKNGKWVDASPDETDVKIIKISERLFNQWVKEGQRGDLIEYMKKNSVPHLIHTSGEVKLEIALAKVREHIDVLKKDNQNFKNQTNIYRFQEAVNTFEKLNKKSISQVTTLQESVKGLMEEMRVEGKSTFRNKQTHTPAFKHLQNFSKELGNLTQELKSNSPEVKPRGELPPIPKPKAPTPPPRVRGRGPLPPTPVRGRGPLPPTPNRQAPTPPPRVRNAKISRGPLPPTPTRQAPIPPPRVHGKAQTPTATMEKPRTYFPYSAIKNMSNDFDSQLDNYEKNQNLFNDTMKYLKELVSNPNTPALQAEIARNVIRQEPNLRANLDNALTIEVIVDLADQYAKFVESAAILATTTNLTADNPNFEIYDEHNPARSRSKPLDIPSPTLANENLTRDEKAVNLFLQSFEPNPNIPLPENEQKSLLVLSRFALAVAKGQLTLEGQPPDQARPVAKYLSHGSRIFFDLSELSPEKQEIFKKYLLGANLETDELKSEVVKARIAATHAIEEKNGIARDVKLNPLVAFLKGVAARVKNEPLHLGMNIALGGYGNQIKAHDGSTVTAKSDGHFMHLYANQNKNLPHVIQMGLEESAPGKTNAVTGDEHGIGGKGGKYAGTGASKIDKMEDDGKFPIILNHENDKRAKYNWNNVKITDEIFNELMQEQNLNPNPQAVKEILSEHHRDAVEIKPEQFAQRKKDMLQHRIEKGFFKAKDPNFTVTPVKPTPMMNEKPTVNNRDPRRVEAHANAFQANLKARMGNHKIIKSTTVHRQRTEQTVGEPNPSPTRRRNP